MNTYHEYISYLMFLLSISLFTSCNKVVVEYDCGEINTRITEMDQEIGSYTSTQFNELISTNYETAAILVRIKQYEFESEPETSCFSFQPIPQEISKLEIESSESVFFQNEEYPAGKDLADLFTLYNRGVTYSVPEFISAHGENPLLFHNEEDEIVLQLSIKPDSDIDQSFEIKISFTDQNMIEINVPKFVVEK